jgi:hypothetical protein
MKKYIAFAALLIACVVTLAILSDKQSGRKVVGEKSENHSQVGGGNKTNFTVRVDGLQVTIGK